MLLLTCIQWTMTQSQCKHLVSKSICTRFVFHPRAYFQIRRFKIGIRNSVLNSDEAHTGTDSDPSHQGTNTGYSVKKDDPIPQPTATDGPGLQLPSPSCFPSNKYYLYKDTWGAWPFHRAWPLLPCSSHYSFFPIPTTTERKMFWFTDLSDTSSFLLLEWWK